MKRESSWVATTPQSWADDAPLEREGGAGPGADSWREQPFPPGIVQICVAHDGDLAGPRHECGGCNATWADGLQRPELFVCVHRRPDMLFVWSNTKESKSDIEVFTPFRFYVAHPPRTGCALRDAEQGIITSSIEATIRRTYDHET